MGKECGKCAIFLFFLVIVRCYEYKESWRDEYLKWICGFANAQGGTIYIGIDDSGKVVGEKNIKKLLEDLPNKIQSGLGIACEVNKLAKDTVIGI